MRTIEVPDPVGNEIAKKGKFGETEDDVLRRVWISRLNGLRWEEFLILCPSPREKGYPPDDLLRFNA